MIIGEGCKVDIERHRRALALLKEQIGYSPSGEITAEDLKRVVRFSVARRRWLADEHDLWEEIEALTVMALKENHGLRGIQITSLLQEDGETADEANQKRYKVSRWEKKYGPQLVGDEVPPLPTLRLVTSERDNELTKAKTTENVEEQREATKRAAFWSEVARQLFKRSKRVVGLVVLPFIGMKELFGALGIGAGAAAPTTAAGVAATKVTLAGITLAEVTSAGVVLTGAGQAVVVGVAAVVVPAASGLGAPAISVAQSPVDSVVIQVEAPYEDGLPPLWATPEPSPSEPPAREIETPLPKPKPSASSAPPVPAVFPKPSTSPTSTTAVTSSPTPQATQSISPSPAPLPSQTPSHAQSPTPEPIPPTKTAEQPSPIPSPSEASTTPPPPTPSPEPSSTVTPEPSPSATESPTNEPSPTPTITPSDGPIPSAPPTEGPKPTSAPTETPATEPPPVSDGGDLPEPPVQPIQLSYGAPLTAVGQWAQAKL
ncbi:hypothetical protein ABZV14_06030 [Streptosporangium canum]|uniref:hypothetical protein n=1 Tax=Streptosporangium canum TaxID=324952 RepID=UPI0033BED417